MVEKKKKKYGKAGSRRLDNEEEGKIRNETLRKTELAEIKQNLWRAYRDNGKLTTARTRPSRLQEGRKQEGKAHHQNYPSVADCFSTKNEEKIRRTKQLEDHWDLMKVCVKYIEENEEWLTTNRMERTNQQEERRKMWEKEDRLARMSQNLEAVRKISDKKETATGEEKDTKMHKKAGKYEMDGKVDENLTGKAWNYWRQKSPMMPRAPALGHNQAQGEGDAQSQDLHDADNRQQDKIVTSQVEGRLTVSRIKLFEENVENVGKIVDFKKNFTHMTVSDNEEEPSKKEEDAQVKEIQPGKIGKIMSEMSMRARRPRQDAALRSTMSPNHCRSAGKVVKSSKGTPRKSSSIVRNLRKCFEASPTRGPTELLLQLTQPTSKGIKFNLGTTTASTRQTLKFCVDQRGRVKGTGPRQDWDRGHQPGQDWTKCTDLDTAGPIPDAVPEC